jgi:hypothetical protein
MNRLERKRLKNKLAKDNVCYVLITCAESSEDGDMQVEMSYEGDAVLASYLVHGAQAYFDEHDDSCIQASCNQSKVLSFNG